MQGGSACEALGKQKGDDAAGSAGTGLGVFKATELEGPSAQEGR